MRRSGDGRHLPDARLLQPAGHPVQEHPGLPGAHQELEEPLLQEDGHDLHEREEQAPHDDRELLRDRVRQGLRADEERHPLRREGRSPVLLLVPDRGQNSGQNITHQKSQT